MRQLLTRALRACLTASAGLFLITCTDNPVGPGRPGLGSLRVAPTFDAFARNAPLTLDNVRVIVVRPPSDTLASVARSFSVSSSQLTLNIPLQLQAASEDLEVTLELYAGTTLLFSGTRIVRVSQGISPPPDSVPVAYQGPGATIAAITIGPRDTTVLFGGTFAFGATAVDSQQAPVASFYVGWTASAGTIDAAGQFTAPAVRDTVTVTATTPSGITDQTTVIVAAAPATLVKVSGDNQTAPVGSLLPQPLVVRVDGSDGLPVAGVPVTFAATTGGGSVDSATVVSSGSGLAVMGATLGATVGAQSFTATAPGLTAVVFGATGTSLSPIATWSGATDTSWTTASNWSTGAVPTATTDVVIPSGTPRSPYITTTPGTVRDLTVQSGANLTMGPSILTVNGSLDVPGSITGNTTGINLNGTGTVRGNFTGSFFGLDVNGTYALSGALNALSVNIDGQLTLAGFTARVGGAGAGNNFQTSNAGVLVMQSANDSLIMVGGNPAVTFDGGSTAGLLTAGVIVLSNSGFATFRQDNTFNAASYAPSGTHKVVLATGSTLSLDFSTPGAGSHFNILDISAQTPGFSLATPIVVNGLFISTPSATAPAITGGNRLITAAGGTQVTGLTLTNAPFAITGGAVTFNNVTFQGMVATATQLIVSGPGAATPLTLSNLVFSTVPTTGFYLSASDTDGPTPNALAISMVNPTPAAPGAFTQVTGGATINWAPGAVKTWTGTTSTDWSVATNWSPSGVPIFSEDVTIPAAPPNQPTLGTTGNVGSLTVQAGATLTLNGTFTFNVNGDLDVSGTMALAAGAPTLDLRGAGRTVRGNIPINTGFSGSYTLNGATDVAGALSVGGGGSSLTLAGFFLSAASVNVGSGGLLIMTAGSDFLDVAGNVTMGGGDHTGRLTNGVMQVGGNFLQTSAGSTLSFAASGLHLVSLVGPTSTINFQSPGTAASRFHDLNIIGGVSASLATRAVATGNVSVTGALTLGGRTLEVGGTFSTSNPGTVTMTNALDSLLVGGTATFNGGVTTGLLTAGTLRVGGSITQGGSNAGAFDASGTHRTVLTGTTPLVNFQGTGNTSGTSHFQEVTWAGGGTMTISTTTYALGQLTVSSAGTIAGQTFVQSLHVGQLANAAALTLFNTQLWIETTAAVPVALSNLTITVGSGVNALYIRHPGLPAGGKLTLDQITFTSTPTGGFVYLDVDDTNTGDGNLVVVDVSNSSPAASSLVLTANGATVNWPAASPVKTWLGLTQDWHTTTNWSPAGLPTATDDVTIPVTANQPIMSATGTARNLTVASGVLLNLNSFNLTVNGDVSAPNATSFIGGGGTLVLAGTARSIGGTLSGALPVNVTGTYMLSSRTVIGNLTVSGTGDLAPIGNTLVVSAALSTTGSGTLTMTDPLDSVLVTGAAIFGGGFTGGRLTDGYLKVGGSFSQTSGTTAGSFAASGLHKTELGAAAVRVVNFASPGFGTGTSQFNDLDITGATGGLTINSNVAVLGTFIAAPSAGTPLLSGGGGQIVTIQGGTQVTGLIVDAVPIVADLAGGGPLQFDGVTFQNMPVTAIQLAINHPGAPSPFALTNLIFNTPPSSGFYLQATDTDGPSPDILTLDLVTPTPGTDGGFSQALGGAVINWPFVSPIKAWTGAVSTDWSNPGNWSPAGVPTLVNDVTIGPAGNQPTLTAASVANSITISGAGGQLTIGGQTLTITLSLVTHTDGLLVMTNPADVVIVGGDATFQGGNETGLLTAGELRVAGAFNQQQQTDTRSFVASGTHRTIMTGASLQSVRFCCGVPVSGFQQLDISSSAGINYQFSGNGVVVFDTLIAQVGTGPAPMLYALGNTLTAARLKVDKLVVDRGTLTLNEGGVAANQQLDNVTFQNYLTTQTQLAIIAPGGAAGARTLTFNNLAFQPLVGGNTGRYLNVTAPTGTLVVDLPGGSPAANGPAFTITSGAATVNWPAAAAGTWTGAVSTDWFTAGNWSGGLVPGAGDTVTIGTATPNAPTLNASTTVNSLTINNAGTLNLTNSAVLTLNGNLDAAAGGIMGPSIGGAGEAVQLTGGGVTIQGTIQFADLAINGRTSVVGVTSVLGSAALTDTLDITNQVLVISGDFSSTGPAALILSTQAGAQLSIGGNATFDGGNELGSMTNGALTVAGDFTQLATHSGDSYHPSGVHLTVLNNTGNSVVSFATPGTVPGTSHFQELAIGGSALDTVTFASDVFAHGNLQQTSADTTFFTSGDRTLTVGGALFGNAVVFDNTRLVINATAAGSTLFLGSVGFRNMNPLATQLSISDPGSGVPVTLTNATFTTLPTAGGFYISATDTDGPSVVFTIDLVNPSPATPGPFAQALNGAVINWPATGPVISWTGAVDADWFTAGNWSNNQVPGIPDSVIIPATPNDPVLTSVTVVGAVEIQGGTLVLNGQTMAVLGTFRTSGTGTITMTNPADSLHIPGNADFSGGDQTGLITAGVIQVNGNFTQGGTPAAPGFVGSGTNVVRLVGGTTSLTTVGSNLTTVFANLELATSGPVTLNSTTSGLNMDGTGRLDILNPVAVTYVQAGGAGALSFAGGTFTTAGSTVGGPFVSLFPGSSIQGAWTVDTTGWSQGAALQLQVPNTISYNHLVLQQGNNFFFDPGTFTIPGSLITRVVNAGTIRVRDTLGARTLLGVGGTTQVFGRLTLDGGKLTTASLDVATLGGSRGFLVMQGAADSVIAAGNAAFGGGSTVGLLTAGVLQVQGNFGQTAATSVASFAPSGSHKTLLGASTARTATFASPGAGAAGSHFQVLDMTAASGGLTLASNAIVDSAFVVGVAAGAPKLVGGGNSLTARQWLVQGMDVDNAPMILNEQGAIFPHTFNNVSFAGFPASGAQVMSITGVGSNVGLRPAFNPSNVDFVALPTGAGNLYVKLTSTNSEAFIISMPGSNQSPQIGGNGPALSDPPNSTTVNGALINWP